MKAKDIFIKTMPFVWAKFVLWLVTIVVSIIWFAILALIAGLANNSGFTFFAIVIGIGGVSVARFILMRYFGYLIKAGHIAVIAEAVVTGQVPANQVEYGKKAVVERFATANVFFLVDNLVGGAVKQLQRVVGRVGNMLKFIPGMGAVTNIAQFFVEISLGYVDECCLGYTFYNKDQSAFKSAADGVVIYAQNWKALLANAAKTMLKVILLMIVIGIVFLILITSLLNLFMRDNPFSIFIAIILACIIAVAVKSAFMDSYILVETMAVYMQLAPETVITYNLYDKLCGMSRKFRELFNKAKEEQPSLQPEPAYAGADAGSGYYEARYTDVGNAGMAGGTPAGGAAKAAYCPNCGSKHDGKSKFCGNCGQLLA